MSRATAGQGGLALVAAALLFLPGLRLISGASDLRGRRLRSEALAQLGLVLWAWFLQTPQSEWLWGLVPGMGAVQFPWRFSAFQLLAAAFLVATALTPEMSAPRRVVAVGILLVAALPALWTSVSVTDRRPYVFDESRLRDPRVQGRVTYEYIPADVQGWLGFPRLQLDGVPGAELAGPGRILEQSGATHERSFRIESTAANRLRLRTFAYPGWTARVDGEPAALRASGPLRQIEVALPPGGRSVDVTFGSTPVRRVATGLSLLGVLLVLGIVGFGRTRAPGA